MKKDKEWLENGIRKEAYKETRFYDPVTNERKTAYRDILELVNQLDEVEKEPRWVVRVIAPSSDTWYFVEFIEDISDPFSPSVSTRIDRAYKFTDKAKAEAVALLVDGEVEVAE